MREPVGGKSGWDREWEPLRQRKEYIRRLFRPMTRWQLLLELGLGLGIVLFVAFGLLWVNLAK